MKVHFISLGCKLNTSEIDEMARQFVAEGHEIVAAPEAADLCVVNTCSVTQSAVKQSRQAVRHVHKVNPAARTVVTGCYAQLHPDEAAHLPGVELVVPNLDKDRLVRLVQRHWRKDYGFGAEALANPDSLAADALLLNPSPLGKTRAFVKIADGCNMRCTFCLIPLTRGRDRSRSPDDVVRAVRALVEAGHQEILLTGVQISVYGRDMPPEHRVTLRDLVRRVLDETGVRRLRLSSIAPWDLNDGLIDLWRDPRLCRHMHLSLQSGSDTVLKRMKRPHTAANYAAIVERARAAIPGLAITTDVIVGFPGETDAEHEESLRAVERIGFARTHVFRYSPRPGTAAAALPNPVPGPVAQARAQAMIEVGEASARRFAASLVGGTFDVLWESRAGETWTGLTDNYVRVQAIAARDLHNQVTPTRVVALADEGVWGEVE